MAIARITGQGLIWIAALVTLLWVCILTESRLVIHARAEAQRSLHELRVRRFKLQAEPASVPVIRPSSVRPSAG